MEKVIEKQIDACEESHQTGLHEKQQSKIQAKPFDAGTDGGQPRPETDNSSHGKKWRGYAV